MNYPIMMLESTLLCLLRSRGRKERHGRRLRSGRACGAERAGKDIPEFPGRPADQTPARRDGCPQRRGRYPEPAESCKYLWSENFGLVGSDAVMNQWGVICVSNGTHTKEESIEDLRKSGDVVHGGINYMLRIELAKRAKTAREGIETFARLIDQFGYGGSGTSFVIADPKEAWIFTAVMGKRWVAQRVPDNAVVLLPNVNIIQEIDLNDPSRFLASPDLVSYAEKKGWYDPKKGKRFNFRDAYDKRSWAGWFERAVPLRSEAVARPVPRHRARYSPASPRPPSLLRQAEPQAHGQGYPATS